MNEITPQSPLTVLYGISDSRAALFEKLDIKTIDDLVRHYPRTYENRGDVKTVSELNPFETASLILTIDSPLKSTRIPSRSGRPLSVQKITASDETGAVAITFFNQDYLKSTLVTGRKFRFYGSVTGGFLTPQMTSPAFEPYRDGIKLDNLVPVYPLTAGITRGMITGLIKRALPTYEKIESLPESILSEFSLRPLYPALHDIHFPNDAQDMESARRRLAFEELLNFQLRLRALKERGRKGKAVRFRRPDMNPFFDSLPYALTSAQKRTIDELLYDMTRRDAAEPFPISPTEEYTEPMRRLVQGDVGSGKTVVAAAAVYVCVKNGMQAALMAPTEILAEQHYKSLLPLMEGHRIATALLTGSTKAAEKKKILSALAQGKIDFIIGTHALIEDSVVFARPGLTVTDEQHRFGVKQRQRLSGKVGENNAVPHMLVMSATPIPRTLAMILYGDLDLSIMDELPPGRQKVDTFAVGEPMRARIYAFIEKQIAAGHQCYIVCPLAEKSEGELVPEEYETELKSAKDYCEKLQAEVFPHRRVAFLHGKMKPAEKEKIMRAFSDGETDILVSTTVIEVGVNVPNATLMVVENAERFGLSQLHQLRGRVGRGKDKSFCVLMSPVINGALAEDRNEVEKRLGILCKYESGFKIAEFDLKNRGPGDFFGQRQHGELRFKIADLAADMTLIEQTKELADRLCRQKANQNKRDSKEETS